MLIEVIQTKNGSPNGIKVEKYVKGGSYDLPNDLAQVFIDNGWGKEAKATKPKENKMLKQKRDNK